MTRVIVLRSLATSTDTESMTHAEEARVVHPDLTGKKVLVTGGARGLGAAMAAAFAKAGASVMIADTDLSTTNRYAEINTKPDRRAA